MTLSFKPLTLAACFALPLAATAQEAPTIETVVATVNGTEITMAHVLNAQRDLPEQYRQLPPSVLFQGLVDQLVQQEALSQAAGDTPFWVGTAVENLERQLRAGLIVEEVLTTGVSEEDIRAYYDAQFANADPDAEYNAAHILVETEEEALALVEELSGGADFANLAREKSTGPSGPNGGDLGWFGQGMMVAPFEEAVLELSVGEVSAPVQTQFGWHVIKLNDKRSAAIPPFEDVRSAIAQQLEQEAVTQKIAELQDAADVTISIDGIDPSVLTTLPLFANSQ